MINDLVSVVIPTQNRSEVLKRAVNSALNQTYKNIEVIVVSDNSTDSTDEVMEKIKREFNNVFYFSYSPSKGGNYARNLGISHSKGKYIAFLDDDDEWLPEKIQKQLNVFEKDENMGLVCTGQTYINDDNGTSYKKFFEPSYDCSKEILKSNVIGPTITVMVKKDILQSAGLFDVRLPAKQDYDLWIRICQITKIGFVKEPLVNYHNSNKGGQISHNYQKYLKANEILDEKYKELREEKLTKKEIKNIHKEQTLSVARKAFKSSNKKECRKILRAFLRKNLSFKGFIYLVATFFPAKLVEKKYFGK